MKGLNSTFLMACAGFYLIGAWLLLTQDKGFAVLWLNARHSPLLDIFFAYITWVGDGVFYALVIVALFFWQKKAALLGLLSFALNGGIVQLSKKVIFPDAPRPISYFGDSVHLQLVEGVSMHAWQSFPSGHTTTAFACFCLLSLLFRSKIGGIVFFLLALLAGTSRMYLAQHFFEDVYTGALLGVLSTYCLYWLLYRDVEGYTKQKSVG